jgi:leucyl-tRNA synthetase
MKKYQPEKIEKKWQKHWEEKRIFKDYSRKEKYYALDMFPYPSGSGLHVGHPKGYVATDIVARFEYLRGKSVLHPMGWDAFGLPAENYAIKNKLHPKQAVEENVRRFKEQLEKIGFTYDWDREINTTDSEYYKWTQWIFLKMFEKGLAYESEEPVNWCGNCKTVLANEDLEQGKCERCGGEITQRPLRQWVLKMTEYADRLLEDLESEELNWEKSIIDQQKNWIGRSEGVVVKFPLVISSEAKQSRDIPSENEKVIDRHARGLARDDETVEVFTTRVDTIFGCTYIVLAPEHNIVESLKSKVKNWDEVEKYVEQSKKKTAMERGELNKEKTGVKLEGIEAINPFTGKSVPVFVADYVLGSYGTGAVMAVPAHDERDWDFAKKYHCKVIESISQRKTENQRQESGGCFTGDGVLVDSGEFTGLPSEEAREKMAEWLEKTGKGHRSVKYKMRDWVFSRQRYWGEPMPILFCQECKKLLENSNFQFPIFNSKEENFFEIEGKRFSRGEILNPGCIAVSEEKLPLELPEVDSYEPTDTGESPLANISEWVNTTCPKCGGDAKRETNTMPQWAGSSWYYLAYSMRGISNFQFPISKYTKAFDSWLPVDLYVGGAEHATRHLLYARFWHKFLYDIGVVKAKEPFKRLVSVGLINAEDGRKMSKRWGNVINPDDVVREFGADSLRLYEMFMGPFTQNISWSTEGVSGVRRFLEKTWKNSEKVMQEKKQEDKEIETLLHKTIKKVTEDIEAFRFNTAISSLMILANKMEKAPSLSPVTCKLFTVLLSPFAPHIAEELWQKLGYTTSIFLESWPEYNEALTKDDHITLVLQVNGKVRDKLEVEADIGEEEAKKIAFKSEKIQKYLNGNNPKKIIYVPGKLVNIVA